MMVNDVTRKQLEEARFRRISAGLIDGAKPEALEILVRPFYGSANALQVTSTQIARDYFSGDAATKEKMALLLTRFGITPDHVEAKAAQLVASELLVFDRMSGNRETSRRVLRKEHKAILKERERRAATDKVATASTGDSKTAEA